MAVRLSRREIVGQFRTTLTLLHHFCEIGLGLLILIAALCLTLLLRELEEAEPLRFDGFPV